MQELTESIGAVLSELGLTVLPPGPGGDLVVRIPTVAGPVRAQVHVRNRSQPMGPAEVLRWVRDTPPGSILALPHVTTEQGRRYRAAGAQYVDTGGNAFIDHPGFHVQIEGRRPSVEVRAIGRSRRPSSNAAGLQVVFVLLVRPEHVRLPYESLSRLAQVSKGTVTSTMRDLRTRGHVFGEGDRRLLVDVERLRQDWFDGYARDLGPRLETVAVHGPPPTWWLTGWHSPEHGLLSGGPALADLGARLRPDRTIVYAVPPWQEPRRLARLGREGSPNVVLRERFWSADLADTGRFAPRLLVLADALAMGDAREIEAARELLDEKILG